MLKTVLRRVKVGEFCTHVRWAAETLPEFLDTEKREILRELETIEGQTNAIRRNEYGRLLTKEIVPKLKNSINILALQLKYADATDENANTMRNFINTYFKGRHSMEHITTWAEGLITLDAPADTCSSLIFIEVQEETREMLRIKRLYAEEEARIASIGRTIDTRMRIIDLLFQALEVAKGMRHRESTREAANDAVDTLEVMAKEMKRHLPRRKRKKTATTENANIPIAQADSNTDETADSTTETADNQAQKKRCINNDAPPF